jgi:CBS domain-containing protein
MQTKIVTIGVTERLSTVEDIMTLGRVRHRPVVHGGQLVGVLSQRDLLRASLSELGSYASEARRAFLHAIEIERVMSAPPIVIDPDASVQLAARLRTAYRGGICRKIRNRKDGSAGDCADDRYIGTDRACQRL